MGSVRDLGTRAADFTLGYAEKVTGVKAADIAKFAREFATSQPSAIRIGVAIERSAGGAQAARAVYAIPAVAGPDQDRHHRQLAALSHRSLTD